MPSPHYSTLKFVGNAFYNGTEISAQEAAWQCLSLPMCKSRIKVEYKKHKQNRVKFKNVKAISKLDENSTDIYVIK